MNVLVLGPTGLLGHKMVQVLRDAGHRVDTAGREDTNERAWTYLDAENPQRERVVRGHDAVVNCIGLVPRALGGDMPASAILVNSVFPHEMAQECLSAGARFIHFSTDCVFSGLRGRYTEADPPDADSLYGRSKALGEPPPPTLTLRTSFIGPEVSASRGLLNWLLAHRGHQVPGYNRAIFSGLTSLALARLTTRLLVEHPRLGGVWHVSAAPISKLALLTMLADAYGLDVEIRQDDSVAHDRSLDSSAFRSATGWEPQGWPEMIAEMRADL